MEVVLAADEEKPTVAEPAGLQPATTGRHPRAKRVLTWLAASLAVVLVVTGTGGYLLWRHFNGNITHLKRVNEPSHSAPPEGLGKSQNILLIGSDTRAFKGGVKYGSGIAGARSDTTILVHLSADGKHATLVSIPRDTYAHIPSCRVGTQTTAPEWNKFNAAFSVGGPYCTIALVENLTGLRVDHFVEINFAGFQRMVNALGGVSVCLSHPINDPKRINPATGGHIGSGLVISAGQHTLNGTQALGFVRARYAVGDGSDLGRIKDQQVFLASMIRKATSTGLLFHPFSLYRFLDAATKSIATDPGFGLSQLRSLAGKLHGLKPGKVNLLTVPLSNSNAYVDIGGIPASVVYWDKPAAQSLWRALGADKALPGTRHHTPSPGSSATPSPTPSSLDVVTANNARCTV